MADKKEELFKMLNKALFLEEAGMVILGSTYRSFVEKGQVANLKASQKERLIGILNQLIKDSEKHGKLLRGLIGRISREKRNAS